MKILFLGTPESAVPILDKILTTKHEVVGVVTQPPRKSGRGQEMTESAVSVFAKERKLNLFCPDRINKEFYDNHLKSTGAEVAIVVAYGQILPTEILNELKNGWINLHYSILPKFRGAAPVQHAILKGEKETGISFFKIDEGLDTGPIIAQYPYKLDNYSTTISVINELNKIACEKLSEILDGIENSKMLLIKQDKAASFAPKITEKDLQIEWTNNFGEIDRKVRAGNKNVYAWSNFQNLKVKIISVSKGETNLQIPPGEIEIQNKKFIVGCLDDCVVVHEVIPAGKKQMDAFSWINGIQDKSNLKFS